MAGTQLTVSRWQLCAGSVLAAGKPEGCLGQVELPGGCGTYQNTPTVQSSNRAKKNRHQREHKEVTVIHIFKRYAQACVHHCTM